jgi:hypothetical protein
MTTYTEIAKGATLTLLNNNTPYIAQSAGEGAPGRPYIQEDQVAATRTWNATAGNGLRLLRFPSSAKVKCLEVFTDLSLIDGGTSSTALVWQIGVIFSNDGNDGTPVSYQNLHPTTVGIGGGTTTKGTAVAIYGTSANFIFGELTALSTSGAFPTPYLRAANAPGYLFGTEITFNGAEATYSAGGPVAISQVPLVSIFNFWDGRGNTLEDMGYVDLLIGTKTAYNTQPAAGYNVYARIEYTL